MVLRKHRSLHTSKGNTAWYREAEEADESKDQNCEQLRGSHGNFAVLQSRWWLVHTAAQEDVHGNQSREMNSEVCNHGWEPESPESLFGGEAAEPVLGRWLRDDDMNPSSADTEQENA